MTKGCRKSDSQCPYIHDTRIIIPCPYQHCSKGRDCWYHHEDKHFSETSLTFRFEELLDRKFKSLEETIVQRFMETFKSVQEDITSPEEPKLDTNEDKDSNPAEGVGEEAKERCDTQSNHSLIEMDAVQVEMKDETPVSVEATGNSSLVSKFQIRDRGRGCNAYFCQYCKIRLDEINSNWECFVPFSHCAECGGPFQEGWYWSHRHYRRGRGSDCIYKSLKFCQDCFLTHLIA